MNKRFKSLSEFDENQKKFAYITLVKTWETSSPTELSENIGVSPFAVQMMAKVLRAKGIELSHKRKAYQGFFTDEVISELKNAYKAN